MEELTIQSPDSRATIVLKYENGLVHTAHIKYFEPIPLHKFIQCDAILNLNYVNSCVNISQHSNEAKQPQRNSSVKF